MEFPELQTAYGVNLDYGNILALTPCEAHVLEDLVAIGPKAQDYRRQIWRQKLTKDDEPAPGDKRIRLGVRPWIALKEEGSSPGPVDGGATYRIVPLDEYPGRDEDIKFFQNVILPRRRATGDASNSTDRGEEEDEEEVASPTDSPGSAPRQTAKRSKALGRGAKGGPGVTGAGQGQRSKSAAKAGSRGARKGRAKASPAVADKDAEEEEDLKEKARLRKIAKIREQMLELYPSKWVCSEGDKRLEAWVGKGLDLDGEYEAERIVDERRSGRKRFFRIKFYAWELEEDWQPMENATEEMIRVWEDEDRPYLMKWRERQSQGGRGPAKRLKM